MKRRRMFQTFKAAAEAGQHTDLPMLPAQVDPQIFLSRNSVAQPFFLICGKDTVLAHMLGEAELVLKYSSVNSFALAPGDNVYVPAGTPHRVIPLTDCVQLRYKARSAGLEGVACTCRPTAVPSPTRWTRRRSPRPWYRCTRPPRRRTSGWATSPPPAP